MTVLNKAFSNWYYYIYTYEQPILRQLAPIQTSNCRDVIHSTRIQDQGDSYSGRTDLDLHTDTTVAGRNCTVIHYTERSCDVAPFSDTYEPYYIYTYEQPRLRRLAPIQMSNRRDVIHSTRIQYQGDSYSGRT